MHKVTAAFWVLLVLSSFPFRLLGQDGEPRTPPLAPLPVAYDSVRLLAEEQGYPLGSFDPRSAGPLQEGDRAAFLVTFQEGKKERQWLVLMKVVPPNEQERTEISKVPATMVLYSSLGSKLEFQNRILLVELKTFGPFSKDKPLKQAEPKIGRSGLNIEHLQLGFDRACTALFRVRQNSQGQPVGINFRGTPFPEADAAKGRQFATAAGITPEDEKAFAGAVPAVFGFFQVTANTPGLQNILKEVLDIPILSILANGGRLNPNFNIDGRNLAVLGTRGEVTYYSLPLSLEMNGKRALDLSFEVGPPTSPFLATAGIAAVRAQHPKEKTTRAFIEVIHAKRAPEEPTL